MSPRKLKTSIGLLAVVLAAAALSKAADKPAMDEATCNDVIGYATKQFDAFRSMAGTILDRQLDVQADLLKNFKKKVYAEITPENARDLLVGLMQEKSNSLGFSNKLEKLNMGAVISNDRLKIAKSEAHTVHTAEISWSDEQVLLVSVCSEDKLQPYYTIDGTIQLQLISCAKREVVSGKVVQQDLPIYELVDTKRGSFKILVASTIVYNNLKLDQDTQARALSDFLKSQVPQECLKDARALDFDAESGDEDSEDSNQ
jgi:hypothetical protein